MRYVVWGLVLVLVILHQDNWLWDNPSLVWGFMPITLLYHACISIAASFTWYLATVYAWPDDLERSVLEEVESEPAPPGVKSTS